MNINANLIEPIKEKKNKNTDNKNKKLKIKGNRSLEKWEKKLKKRDKNTRKERAEKMYELHQKFKEIPEDILERFDENLNAVQTSYVNDDDRSTFIHSISAIEGYIDDVNEYEHNSSTPWSFYTKVDVFTEKKKIAKSEISLRYLKNKYRNERIDISHGINKIALQQDDVQKTMNLMFEILKNK